MNSRLFIALPVLAALLVNAAIFGLHWNGDALGTSWLDPPGWLIGAIWTVLLCCMGVALWRGTRSAAARSARLPQLVLCLIVLCLAYPFYTSGFQSGRIGLIGNAVTFVYAAWIAARAWPVERKTALPLIPVLCWLAYASLITTHKLQAG